MSDMESNLMLTLFLMHFRRQLIEYRCGAAIDQASPGEVLDVVVRSLDRAIQLTKSAS